MGFPFLSPVNIRASIIQMNAEDCPDLDQVNPEMKGFRRGMCWIPRLPATLPW